MTMLSILLFLVMLVVGTGAYRVYLWLAMFLTAVVHPVLSKHISFTVVVVTAVGLCYPFLFLQSVLVQMGAWCVYLGLAAIGAWHLFDCLQRFRNCTPRVDS